MNKKREELIEKLLKEMFYAFRSMRPQPSSDSHKGGYAIKFGHRVGGFEKYKFGRGHMDLFFRLAKEKNGISVKEIAESLHITPGAVTQIVDKAVEIGMATREEDPNDRRSQKIKLSEKARARVKEFRSNFVERLSSRFSNLTDTEVSQLITLLDKINRSSSEKEDPVNLD